ncbi:MAG: adenylosuccinate lyase family protein [Syntrophaceae bacterium]|nr:adenylosuccinate lyase family protein [Syntrophaceae bacterium]
MQNIKMRNIFNEKAKLQRWLDIEAALARAEASLGIIPKEAAAEISAKAKIELIDMEFWQKEFKRTIHVIMSTVHSLQKICKGNVGEYIHWGPTSQDIVDTANQMAYKAAHQEIFSSLREIESILLVMADKEADTVMAGRTHGQQALPITFGFKVAVWIREIRRHIERMMEIRKRLFVGQLCGGVGTYSILGELGPEVEKQALKDLGLEAPDICWQAAPDRVAEFACLMAMIGATFGKIANEIYTLQRTEIREVWEPHPVGRIGSSTMPHKRNPFVCEYCISLAKRLRYYAPLIIEAMLVEHERGDGGWYVHRDNMGEMCIVLGDLLTRMTYVIKGIEVHADIMKENLDMLKGRILSEAVMAEMGKTVGRQTAHELLFQALIDVDKMDLSLKEVMKSNRTIAKHFTDDQIDELLNPERHIGLSFEIAKKIVSMTLMERNGDLIDYHQI